MFLASSNEALQDMREVATWIEEAGLEAKPWDDPRLFMPGVNTFSRLIEISKEVDAAIFLFTEDDRVWYRTDAVSQPRDNVLIEYGLFAGALGQRRAIICRTMSIKTASDLQGIVTVDISPNRKQQARLRIMHWAQNLGQQKEDPAITELVFQREDLKRELDEVKKQRDFEREKARDLESIITAHGVIDFGVYDLKKDGHWKLLFDRSYYYAVLSMFAESLQFPEEWKAQLLRAGLKDVVAAISWDHTADRDRTRFYIAKTLRYMRKLGRAYAYHDLITNVDQRKRSALEELAKSAISRINKVGP